MYRNSMPNKKEFYMWQMKQSIHARPLSEDNSESSFMDMVAMLPPIRATLVLPTSLSSLDYLLIPSLFVKAASIVTFIYGTGSRPAAQN